MNKNDFLKRANIIEVPATTVSLGDTVWTLAQTKEHDPEVYSTENTPCVPVPRLPDNKGGQKK